MPSKVARYKINRRINCITTTSNEQVKNEIKKTIPFTIASKKYLRIKLIKKCKDLNTENYETLPKEIKDTNK